MPTILTHAVAASALIAAFPAPAVPRRWAWAGAVCSMLPDLDVVGFLFGVHYADLWGHRGLTHSFLFAAVLATAAQAAVSGFRPDPSERRGWVWLYLFLATASHGLLDACTNGGLGVAFLSPFDPARHFFPSTPIAVSPIGGRFFSTKGQVVLWSEVRWVWLPSLALVGLATGLRRFAHSRVVATSPEKRRIPPEHYIPRQ